MAPCTRRGKSGIVARFKSGIVAPCKAAPAGCLRWPLLLAGVALHRGPGDLLLLLAAVVNTQYIHHDPPQTHTPRPTPPIRRTCCWLSLLGCSREWCPGSVRVRFRNLPFRHPALPSLSSAGARTEDELWEHLLARWSLVRRLWWGSVPPSQQIGTPRGAGGSDCHHLHRPPVPT